MATVKIKLNIRGNYIGYVGTLRMTCYGTRWCAVDWLSTQVALFGHTVGDKSDITAKEVDEFIKAYH